MNAMDRCDLFLDFLYRSGSYQNWENSVDNTFIPKLIEIESKEEGGQSIVQITNYNIILSQILSHLETERYIIIEPLKYHDNMGFQSKTSYSLTVSGEIFISLGGYKGRSQRENQEKKKAEENRARLVKHDDQIRLLTVVLAAGSIVASIYYCWSMWNYYHHPLEIREYFPH